MSFVPVLALALLAALHGGVAGADEPEKAAAAEEKPFVPPDGWREKKRGKYTVYCRKESEVGTRFQKETCYDQEGIRAMLAAQQDDREKVDQMRRICGSQDACGSR
jgi:invasion protein IalB